MCLFSKATSISPRIFSLPARMINAANPGGECGVYLRTEIKTL